MLKQTIENIIEAESKAKKIVDDALLDAKNMTENAIAEAKKIRDNAVNEVMIDRQKVTETALKEGEENFEKIMTLGKGVAEQIKSDTKTSEVIDLIKIKVLKKYG